VAESGGSGADSSERIWRNRVSDNTMNEEMDDLHTQLTELEGRLDGNA